MLNTEELRNRVILHDDHISNVSLLFVHTLIHIRITNTSYNLQSYILHTITHWKVSANNFPLSIPGKDNAWDMDLFKEV